MTPRGRATPIALTMGDPAGIGGEIALAAWTRRDQDVPVFALLDDPERIGALAHRLGVDADIAPVARLFDAMDAFDQRLPVLPIPLSGTITPGRPDAAAAPSVIASIDKAVELALTGEAAAVVTNPIHKETLYGAGFEHPGHTEYLAAKTGAAVPPAMMLACDALRVVPVTIHLSLREAIETLDEDAIVRCGRLLAESLVRDFAVQRPVIAVAGLNPHAGEGGHMGREDLDIIAPAVARLKAEGIDVSGPLPPDTMFHDAARASYDAALCMYHDQALIPLKTLDFHGGVNVTLGLPFVRTSPDHGTAFDIAGTGRADPSSLVAALRMADQMARRRHAAGQRRPVA